MNFIFQIIDTYSAVCFKLYIIISSNYDSNLTIVYTITFSRNRLMYISVSIMYKNSKKKKLSFTRLIIRLHFLHNITIQSLQKKMHKKQSTNRLFQNIIIYRKSTCCGQKPSRWDGYQNIRTFPLVLKRVDIR